MNLMKLKNIALEIVRWTFRLWTFDWEVNQSWTFYKFFWIIYFSWNSFRNVSNLVVISNIQNKKCKKTTNELWPAHWWKCAAKRRKLLNLQIKIKFKILKIILFQKKVRDDRLTISVMVWTTFNCLDGWINWNIFHTIVMDQMLLSDYDWFNLKNTVADLNLLKKSSFEF